MGSPPPTGSGSLRGVAAPRPGPRGGQRTAVLASLAGVSVGGERNREEACVRKTLSEGKYEIGVHDMVQLALPDSKLK